MAPVDLLRYQFDSTEGGYRRFVALKKKNPDLKVEIAVGGRAECGI